MGESFPCTIVEYMRILIYRVPYLLVSEEGYTPPLVVKDEDDFRAFIVTDPAKYTRERAFLRDYISDKALEQLHNPEGTREDCSEEHVHVVLETKQHIDSFQAREGQCVKIEHDGIEEVAIVDCGEPYVPYPEDRSNSINSVLTAVRMAFELTSAFTKVLDTDCYLTTEGRQLPIIRLGGSATLSVRGPVTRQALATNARNCAGFVAKLEKAIEEGKPERSTRINADYSSRLVELLGALQLEPSTDEAYSRLWFLQLFDRAEKFGKTCQWQVENDRQNRIQEVKQHRNDVAHPGVDRLDGGLVRELQKRIYQILKNKT